MGAPYTYPPKKFPWTNLVLLLFTSVTTVVAGSYLAHFDPDLFRFWIMLRYHPEILLDGLPFAVTLMAILGAHELGHYLYSRHYSVDCSLPYFIPGPNLVGTFGALIMMKSRIPNRQALFDIGAAGPLAGLAVTMFAMIAGLCLAKPECYSREILANETMVLFHPNLMLAGAMKAWSLWRGVGPGFCPDHSLLLIESPLLDASCIGFLVTALNLIPIGQLDGGHISFAVLGRHSRWVTMAALVIIGFMGIYFWPPWLLMGVLLFLLMGKKALNHPPPINPHPAISRGRKALSALILLAFFAIVAPVPVSMGEIRMREESGRVMELRSGDLGLQPADGVFKGWPRQYRR